MAFLYLALLPGTGSEPPKQSGGKEDPHALKRGFMNPSGLHAFLTLALVHNAGFMCEQNARTLLNSDMLIHLP
jgi:hypothetical protein